MILGAAEAPMSAQPFLLTPLPDGPVVAALPLTHGIRVNDRRVLSGIVYVIRHGLQWRDAPIAYDPHKDPLRAGAAWGLTASSQPWPPRATRPSG